MAEYLHNKYLDYKHTDHQHIWHPFTQFRDWESYDPIIIESGNGVYLQDVNGKQYLDGVSSLWCNVHGHRISEIDKAVHAQVDKVSHSTLLGLSHVPICELSFRLNKITPEHLTRYFYADSGSTAVEAALRMAIEWWHKQNSTANKKQQLVSLIGGYHGDTLGAVGVGYLEHFHEALSHIVNFVHRVSPPHVYSFYNGMSASNALTASIEELESFFKIHSDKTAAMIIEPLVQGAAGIWVHPVEYLQAIARLCKKHDVLLIVDEVATGFGKTGTLFAFEQANIEPDFLVLGKGLSAGYFPISAVCTSERIFDGFIGKPSSLKTFFYGQTFAGNPVAAAAAVANLDLFCSRPILDDVKNHIGHLQTELNKHIATLNHVDEIRSCGLMTGIELTKSPNTHSSYHPDEKIGLRIVLEARKRGCIIRPLGNTMVLMPALSMNESELSTLVQVTKEAIIAVTDN